MGRRAELILRIGSEGIEKVGQELDALKARANNLFSQLPKDLQRDLKKGWAAVKDSAQDALITTGKSAALAISGPARTTFDQALREGVKFRSEVTKISIAAGQSFDQVSSRVNATSRRIGELPQTVMDVGRALRQSTGDWNTATDLIDSFADRAAQTDRPLSAMTDAGARLIENFGTDSRAKVDSFFGTIDAQARKAGTAIGLTERLFFSFSDSFGRFSSQAPEKWAGLVTAFQKGQTPAQAERNLGYGMGLVNSNIRGIEQRMRATGELKKGQYLTDENGEMSPENMIRALRYAQKDIVKFHGSRRKAIEIEAGEDAGARREVAGLLNTDLGEAGAPVTPEQRKALATIMGTDAGKRNVGEALKNQRDIDLGMGMAPAQDAMVAVGGGATGAAMEAATGVFSQSVDRFGNAVLNFTGSLGRGAAAGGAGAAAGAAGAAAGAAGGLARTAGKTIGKRVLGAIPFVGTAVSLGLMGYELYDAYQQHKAATAGAGGGDPAAGGGAGPGAPQGMLPPGAGVLSADPRAAARMIAEEQTQRVQKVMIIQPPTGGVGQPYPG